MLCTSLGRNCNLKKNKLPLVSMTVTNRVIELYIQSHKELFLLLRMGNNTLPGLVGNAWLSRQYNRTTCIRHQCRYITAPSCHKCLINTGVEKRNKI